jgi:hypothetical protein
MQFGQAMWTKITLAFALMFVWAMTLGLYLFRLLYDVKYNLYNVQNISMWTVNKIESFFDTKQMQTYK